MYKYYIYIYIYIERERERERERENYSAIENKILSFAEKWMELEIIMLSKISPIKTKPHVFSHMWNIGLIKPMT
jgi:hypothetical protein